MMLYSRSRRIPEANRISKMYLCSLLKSAPSSGKHSRRLEPCCVGPWLLLRNGMDLQKPVDLFIHSDSSEGKASSVASEQEKYGFYFYKCLTFKIEGYLLHRGR